MEFDYKKLGFKCGIEIHQQLEGKKLFCDCPTTIVDDSLFDIEVKRKLRAVIGETGEIDDAALQEMKKNKEYIYRSEKNTSCLVDLDEEPPHRMNQDALNAALQVSLMLKAKVVDEVQTMRKTVVDGSNTTGFQRTSLVARNGYLETSNGKVGIPCVCIEEDAAKIVEQTSKHSMYNLSKLGIPLIEIATDPDIKTPKQCKETAEMIGMILRSTGKAKRGIGTIRQDVNVSIKGGNRIEIKGAQDLKMIESWVNNEINRQIKLLEIKEKVKNITLKEELVDLTPLLAKSESKIIKLTLKNRGRIIGAKLNGFAGLLGLELQPNRRLGSELSDYAKVKSGVGGLFHSDELPKYGITEEEVKLINKNLYCKKEDAFILIADSKDKAENGVKEVIRRANLCKNGVIKEVRKPLPNGTTSFMRAMPGAARMYPETDTVPIKTDIKHITIPELLDAKKDRFTDKLNLGKDLAQLVAKSGKADLFEEFATSFSNVKPAFIAETMFSTPKNLKRKFKVDETVLTENDFKNIFSKLDNNKITKDSVETILLKLCKKDSVNYAKYAPLTDKELELEIKKIIKESKGIEFKLLIGKAMGTLKGRAEGKKVIELLRRLAS